MSQWMQVPDGSIVYVTSSKLYRAVSDGDDLTQVLDEWAATHTGSCTVIDVDANPNITRGTE